MQMTLQLVIIEGKTSLKKIIDSFHSLYIYTSNFFYHSLLHATTVPNCLHLKITTITMHKAERRLSYPHIIYPKHKRIFTDNQTHQETE